MIIQYILFLFTLLVGYWLGTKRSLINDLSTFSSNVKREIKKLTQDELKVGAIKRPTVQHYQEKEIPPLIKEGLDAMEKDFRNIPELNR